jgi:hypothetical protein
VRLSNIARYDARITVHSIALHFTGIAMVACGRNRTRRIGKSAAFGGDSVYRNGALDTIRTLAPSSESPSALASGVRPFG